VVDVRVGLLHGKEYVVISNEEKRVRKSVRPRQYRKESTHAGMVRCLGPCGNEFFSPDKRHFRFCDKCDKSRDNHGEFSDRAYRAGEKRKGFQAEFLDKQDDTPENPFEAILKGA
jgi:hypothetical protein